MHRGSSSSVNVLNQSSLVDQFPGSPNSTRRSVDEPLYTTLESDAIKNNISSLSISSALSPSTVEVFPSIIPRPPVNTSPFISLSNISITTTFPSSSNILPSNCKCQSFEHCYHYCPESFQLLQSSIITLDMLSASENEVPFEFCKEKALRITRRDRSILLTQLPSIMGISTKSINSLSNKINCLSTHMCCNQPKPKVETASSDYSSNTFTTTRRPKVRILSDVPLEEINHWFKKVGIKIGPAVGDENQRNMVKRLFPFRVRLKEGTKPFSKVKKKRWPPGKEFWLQKIVNEGLAYGMYERTISANGKLSDWNAQAIIVDKSVNPNPWDGPRITFNYQNVKEDMLDAI
ncbi:hypothetical protein EPUL_005571 [Erysiphe pulchra]|uniref:Uncharacterized protein n=1 Tax=Erysiphe pulchra TaxID=225359 RepID=A0A2S4PJA6_9PEZI|nr:hypothetical protein EPUL_005571 [Erysiphe pulchra]